MVDCRLFRLVAAVLVIVAAPAAAQIRTVDPSSSEVSSDLAPVSPDEADYGTARPPSPAPLPAPVYSAPAPTPAAPPAPGYAPAPAADASNVAGAPGGPKSTYKQDELFGAAERVFGKGAQGLAKILESILKDQGEPSAYVAGREGGGAIGVGLRYGEGELFHKVEGQKPVYWSGPSIGFDVGGNGAKTFILIYNLYDSEDLFRRFPAAEGNLYVIGGLTASYLRRGDIVIIPIRLGVGWRVGANVGYMKFTHNAKVLPF